MIPAFSALLIGLGLSIWAAVWIHREIEARAWERFRTEMKVNFEIVGNGILRYLDTVRSAKSFAESHPDATPEEWQTYIDGQEWQHRVPALLDIGYAEITNAGSSTNLLVRFSASRDAPLHPPGSGIHANQNYVNALNHARDTGFPGATPVVDLKTNSAVLGQMLFLAAYSDLDSPGVSDRRAAFKGVAFGSIDPEKLWDDLLKKTARGPIAMSLAGTSSGLELAKSPERFRKTVRYGTWEQKWPLLCVARVSFVDPVSQRMPGMIVALGGALSILLFGLMAMQTHHRIKAEADKARVEKTNEELERRVADRTHELSLTNESLKVALSRERELNELKSSFVSTVSHEFRTPLGIVVSSAEILERYFARLSEAERAEHLRSIQQSAAQMTELMEGVLQFSKVEAGLNAPEKQSLDLPKLCHRIADEVQSSTNGRCPIQLTLPVDVGCVYSNENLLRTILINLLSNAVKYSPAGKTVRFEVRHESSGVIFRILDDGIGIPKTDLPKLFSPFQRGSNTTSFAGTGLGLTLVKKCVDLHGGRLDLESHEGVGTTVTVTLPILMPPQKSS